jgi:CheY-like chemotaxis protein
MLFACDAVQARASAFKPTAALAERPKGRKFESTMRNGNIENDHTYRMPWRRDIPMTASNAHDPPILGSLELQGVGILLVEDSWHVGKAMKTLLRILGADVAGPAATTADAERLVAERTPDVAIVDINLREGERADNLIDRLHEQGIPVIVITGYAVVSLPPGKAEAILQKPVSKEQLLAILRPIIAQKMDR